MSHYLTIHLNILLLFIDQIHKNSAAMAIIVAISVFTVFYKCFFFFWKIKPFKYYILYKYVYFMNSNYNIINLKINFFIIIVIF